MFNRRRDGSSVPDAHFLKQKKYRWTGGHLYAFRVTGGLSFSDMTAFLL